MTNLLVKNVQAQKLKKPDLPVSEFRFNQADFVRPQLKRKASSMLIAITNQFSKLDLNRSV